ncbi:LysR family transcriptional regulator [Pantoea sp. 1.19]|uniref:LysR family transcriptional regulator n=1 Tax=Pantoea sp. 1.19 TaxID=1925589 RepID=UPI0009491F63|nr:LysR family transcriptional regulator [Pantoea sp. 1.19]
MDIKQLIYLCNLEKTRHFGRAADASFVSQPTLSMRLKNLEQELGVALIYRNNSFSGFTPEGERVLSWAREIVSVYQGLKLEVESLRQGTSGLLRIGVVPQCSISLAALLKISQQRFPQLDYRVAVLSADQLSDALNRHTVDVGIGFFELPVLRELHFQIALLPDSGVEVLFQPEAFPALCGEDPLPIAGLRELPLCLAEPTRYFRRYLDTQFDAAGLTPRIILESNAILQLLQGAEAGLGCLIAPVGHLSPGITGGLRRRPLALAPMRRQAAMVLPASQRASPLAQRFFDTLQTQLQA